MERIFWKDESVIGRESEADASFIWNTRLSNRLP
jgi:hypothetical protein